MTANPIRWLGGKGRLVDWILSVMPPHENYLEAFGGGAAVLFAKKPSSNECYNDLDGNLVNFFRVLRDPVKREALKGQLRYTPYSREIYEEAREKICKPTEAYSDDIAWARDFYVATRQALSAVLGNSWGYSIETINQAESFSRSVNNLDEFSARLIKVQIEHRNAMDLIPIYDREGMLIYCDPPYPSDTRRFGDYLCEMTAKQHEELLKILVECKAMVMLSSYPSEAYKNILEPAGWSLLTKDVTCSAAARVTGSGLQGAGAVKEKQMRTECLWRNPRAVEVLRESANTQMGLFQEFDVRA